MNFDRLRFIAERAEIGENREAIFAVTIPEKPGSFHRFCTLLGKRAITEFNYRMSDEVVAQFCRFGNTRRRIAQALLLKFQNEGLAALDLTDDEMAKLHIRHMVGGAPTPPMKNYIALSSGTAGGVNEFFERH